MYVVSVGVAFYFCYSNSLSPGYVYVRTCSPLVHFSSDSRGTYMYVLAHLSCTSLQTVTCHFHMFQHIVLNLSCDLQNDFWTQHVSLFVYHFAPQSWAMSTVLGLKRVNFCVCDLVESRRQSCEYRAGTERVKKFLCDFCWAVKAEL